MAVMWLILDSAKTFTTSALSRSIRLRWVQEKGFLLIMVNCRV